MAFTPINSQEEFDEAIKDRISRLNEKHNKELSEKLGSFEQTKSDLAEANKKLSEANTALESQKARLAELETSASETKKQLADRDAQIATFQRAAVKQSIALEYGLPLELANRINGETEEELRKDAESLKLFVGQGVKVPPLANNGAGGDITKDSAFKQMAQNLTKR